MVPLKSDGWGFIFFLPQILIRIKWEDAQQEENLQRTISFFWGCPFPAHIITTRIQFEIACFFAVKVQRCWNVLRRSEENHLSTGRTSLKGINVQTVQLRLAQTIQHPQKSAELRNRDNLRRQACGHKVQGIRFMDHQRGELDFTANKCFLEPRDRKFSLKVLATVEQGTPVTLTRRDIQRGWGDPPPQRMI